MDWTTARIRLVGCFPFAGWFRLQLPWVTCTPIKRRCTTCSAPCTHATFVVFTQLPSPRYPRCHCPTCVLPSRECSRRYAHLAEALQEHVFAALLYLEVAVECEHSIVVLLCHVITNCLPGLGVDVDRTISAMCPKYRSELYEQ